MNALTKISLYCVYKESDISSCCCFFMVCLFVADMFFFSSFHQNSGDSFSPVYAHWQIVSSQNPKFTVDAQPVYRDDETQLFHWLEGSELLFAPIFFFLNICIYCLFRCCSFECTSFECNVLLNYDVNLRQIEIKKFAAPATPGRMLSIVQSLKWNATAPFPRHNFEAVVTVLICWLQCHPGVF